MHLSESHIGQMKTTNIPCTFQVLETCIIYEPCSWWTTLQDVQGMKLIQTKRSQYTVDGKKKNKKKNMLVVGYSSTNVMVDA